MRRSVSFQPTPRFDSVPVSADGARIIRGGRIRIL